ncbi:response regulator [Flavobacterium sp. NRK1]|uniref:response regulator n=1 Tax=Flavobacterium sp. NRK1 TaxID=2954929 RepID=UPI00209240B2|nr:response regulator [Flavobacterium sp. NRK1]MCO6149432.1 response regulator [Flavobacterium sp. NRK1]
MYPEKLHIVLAEDDSDDRILFKKAFEDIKMQHTLHIYEDCLSLMQYLKNVEELPHIIFLDLHMPGMSGVECLKEIKKDLRLQNITIAIYSTSLVSEVIEQTFILGANVYIKKPYDFNKLKKTLTDIIHINWQYITEGLNKENFMISC